MRNQLTSITIAISLLGILIHAESARPGQAQGITREESRRVAEEVVRNDRQNYDQRLLEIAKQELEVAHKLMAGMGVAVTVLAVVITLVSLGGIVLLTWHVDRRVDGRVDDKVEKKIQESEKETRDYVRRLERYVVNFNIGVEAHLGFIAWHDKRLDEAIAHTERALALNPDPEGQELPRIKSNLAYYYAQVRSKHLKAKAIEYAEFARAKISSYPHRAAWAANEAYVRLRFAESPEERQTAVELCRDVMRKYPQLTEEIDEYLRELDEEAE